MSHSHLAVAVTLVFVPLFGGAPKPKEPPKDPAYFPTALGTKWVYGQGERELSYEVTGVERKDGKTIVTRSGGPKGTPADSYVVTADGVFDRGNPRFVYDPPLRKLKLPLTTGDTWEYAEPLLDGLLAHAWKMTVGKEETVEVPAGKYPAVPVVFKVTAIQGKPIDDPETYTFWYAKDVGLVKLSGPRVTRVLKSFTPGTK